MNEKLVKKPKFTREQLEWILEALKYSPYTYDFPDMLEAISDDISRYNKQIECMHEWIRFGKVSKCSKCDLIGPLELSNMEKKEKDKKMYILSDASILEESLDINRGMKFMVYMGENFKYIVYYFEKNGEYSIDYHHDLPITFESLSRIKKKYPGVFNKIHDLLVEWGIWEDAKLEQNS